MHLLIYRERPDVKAVCHAHPPHGTAFAVAGLAIDQPILSEVILTLGCVPLADYGTPSTDELTDAMQPLVKHHNALLMANHGAVAYGSDLVAGVGSSGNSGAHGEDRDPFARAGWLEQSVAGRDREIDQCARSSRVSRSRRALSGLRLSARDKSVVSDGRSTGGASRIHHRQTDQARFR